MLIDFLALETTLDSNTPQQAGREGRRKEGTGGGQGRPSDIDCNRDRDTKPREYTTRQVQFILIVRHMVFIYTAKSTQHTHIQHSLYEIPNGCL